AFEGRKRARCPGELSKNTARLDGLSRCALQPSADRVQRVDGRTDAGLVPISSDRRSSALARRTTLIRLQGGGPPSQTHHDWKVQARFGNDKHVFHIAPGIGIRYALFSS